MDIYKAKDVLEYTQQLDNIKGTASSVAIDIAIKALNNQMRIKEILSTPTLFAEKFDRICEIEKLLD